MTATITTRGFDRTSGWSVRLKPPLSQALGLERNMTDNPDLLRSIRKALWILVALISILALAAAAQLTTNVYWWHYKTKHQAKPQQGQAVRVVVAARDLTAGSVIQRADIGMRSMTAGELPDHFVCVHMVRILPGHKINTDVTKGDPIDLEDTELWTRKKKSQPKPGGDA